MLEEDPVSFLLTINQYLSELIKEHFDFKDIRTLYLDTYILFGRFRATIDYAQDTWGIGGEIMEQNNKLWDKMFELKKIYPDQFKKAIEKLVAWLNVTTNIFPSLTN